jgi:DNA-directed RNA polymerase subunit RPC12/RpoP
VVKKLSPPVPVEETLDLLNVETLFTKKKEIEFAKSLANKYLQDYEIESEGDRNLLKQLVYLETFHALILQKAANDFNKDAGSVPLDILDALHKNINQIVNLKERLGISRKNQKEESDTFKSIELLKRKFKVWRSENQGSRHFSCPHCGKMILLKIKMDAWEAQKHPFFKDRVLASKHLIKLYKDQKITKEDISLILETSPDYIDWLLSKINFDNY